MVEPPGDLVLADVAIARGERTLLAGLDAEFTAGTLAVVSGPNGAGKSTLLRAVAGYAATAAGEVRYGGEPVTRLLRQNRLPFAYHGHADGLKSDLTVAENLRFFLRLFGSDATLPAVADAFDLGAFLALEVKDLSAGQRKRTALARLRIAARAVWVLDEPYTNLDASARALVDALVAAHLAAAGIAVIATHAEPEIACARRVDIAL